MYISVLCLDVYIDFTFIKDQILFWLAGLLCKICRFSGQKPISCHFFLKKVTDTTSVMTLTDVVNGLLRWL